MASWIQLEDEGGDHGAMALAWRWPAPLQL
jgi:hypothetical protein